VTVSPLCPSCGSAHVHLTVPEVVEGITYRCKECGHSWTTDFDDWWLDGVAEDDQIH